MDTELFFPLLAVIVSTICGLVGSHLAAKLGVPKYLGFLLCFLVPIIGFLILAILQKRRPETEWPVNFTAEELAWRRAQWERAQDTTATQPKPRYIQRLKNPPPNEDA